MVDETFFLVRPAERGDIPGIATLFQQAYGQTSHPCANLTNLSEGFRNGERWLVCVAQENLVACAALVPHLWNSTFEAGRSVTLPAYQQQKLGRLLWRDSIRWAAELGEHDLLFATPRTSATCRMCGFSSPPLLLFGHDGGANIANGTREIHAIGLISTTRSYRRAVPWFGPGTVPFFIERICRLNFRNEVSCPPEDLVIGPYGEHCYKTPRGTLLRYSRMGTPQGWSVLVTSVDCLLEEVELLFANFLADSPAVKHVTCYILWDKLALIHSLARLDFHPTAYVPGWYLREGLRHDCLLLSWLAAGEATVENGMEEFLQPIHEALAGLTEVIPTDMKGAELALRQLNRDRSRHVDLNREMN